jgi:hypothetical protein
MGKRPFCVRGSLSVLMMGLANGRSVVNVNLQLVVGKRPFLSEVISVRWNNEERGNGRFSCSEQLTKWFQYHIEQFLNLLLAMAFFLISLQIFTDKKNSESLDFIRVCPSIHVYKIQSC